MGGGRNVSKLCSNTFQYHFNLLKVLNAFEYHFNADKGKACKLQALPNVSKGFPLADQKNENR